MHCCVCVRVCVCVCVCVCTCVCICMCVRACVCMYMSVQFTPYPHPYRHTHTHTCTHAHTLDCIAASSCGECINVTETSDFECGWCSNLDRYVHTHKHTDIHHQNIYAHTMYIHHTNIHAHTYTTQHTHTHIHTHAYTCTYTTQTYIHHTTHIPYKSSVSFPRCSDGFDRHRQEWFGADCTEDVC